MTSLNQLPADILRFLTSEYLEPKDLLSLSSINKHCHQVLRNHQKTWWRLVERFLTENPITLEKHKNNKETPETLFKDLHGKDIPDTLQHAAENGYDIIIKEKLSLLYPDDNDAYYDCICDMVRLSIENQHHDVSRLLLQEDGIDPFMFLPDAINNRNITITKYICESYHKDHEHYEQFTSELRDVFGASFGKEDAVEIRDYLWYISGIYGNDPKIVLECQEAIWTAIYSSVDDVKYLLLREVPLPHNALEQFIGSGSYNGEMVQLLVEKGCRPNEISLDNVSPNQLNIVPYLVSKGASLVGCVRILGKAIAARNIKITRFLLERGLRPNERDMKLIYRNYAAPGSQQDPKTLKLFKLLHEFDVDVTKGRFLHVSLDVQEYIRSISS